MTALTRLGALEAAHETVTDKITRLQTELIRLTGIREQLAAEVETERHTQVRLAVLGDVTREAVETPDPTSPLGIVNGIATMLGVNTDDVLSTSRNRRLINTRMICAWVLHMNGYSSVRIGGVLQRDHSTVLYSIRRVEQTTSLRTTAVHVLETIQQIVAHPHLTAVPDAS